MLRRLVTNAALVSTPANDAAQIAELEAGDEMRVLDIRSGWAWCYGPGGEVGYVPEAAISA